MNRKKTLNNVEKSVPGIDDYQTYVNCTETAR